MNVVSVADKFCYDIFSLRTGADDAWLAVMDRRHCIVQMRQMAGTCIQHCAGLFICRIGVSNRNSRKFCRLCRKLCSSRKFRSDIHDSDESIAAVIKLFERIEIRIPQVRSILGALLFL